ncbi:hypothetical protein GCM10011297_05430 [Bacterioplanes sanyensis]|uniref:SGNH/GDSL hydrolase family protein n=1 Tax=Bacterioplanes sanyensis TaxID=1249553 RepID=UPI0016780B50|nr:SGNH/GDSL hydrolase family protein [Bacterioplanes sanyensis]GGY35266.1 hypothetical protein GCM10011297_05430 [Bacterioplanes sanyensis]
MKHWLSYLGYVALLPTLPWVMAQGRRVRRDTPRLAASGGDCDGSALGDGSATLNLLHLGESTVAGVGVDDIQQGLTAQLACHLQRLKPNTWRQIRWRTIAENGTTAAQLLAKLPKPMSADVLIVTLGVNDTTGFTRRSNWEAHLQAMVERVDCQHVVVTQVPPMQHFPALPKPLNWWLGLRAWQLDQSLQTLAQQHDWLHQPFVMALQPQWMASDGYHPNANGYDLWANAIAECLLAHGKPTTTDRAADAAP